MTTLSLRGTVTTDGAGNFSNLDASDLEPFDLTGKMLKLSMWIDDVSRLADLNLFVGTDGLSNNIKWRFDAETSSRKLAKSGEHFTVTLQFAEINTVAGNISLSPTGKPSTTKGFTDIRLQAADDTTGAITVSLLAVEIVPRVSGAFCSIVFDDSNESVFSRAYPKMVQRKFAGTTYVIVDMLGATDRGNIDGLRVLANAGWEIAGHAYTEAAHGNAYEALPAEDVTTELTNLAEWLRDNFPDDAGEYSFSYPRGHYGDTTDGTAIDTAVAAAGFGTGRTILSSVGTSTHVQISSLPPAMPYRLRAMSGISSANSSQSQYHPDELIAEGGMLDKVASNGGWLILVFHRIVPGTPASTTEINQDDFDKIMGAVADRKMTVAPIREVLRPKLGTTVSVQRARDSIRVPRVMLP